MIDPSARLEEIISSLKDGGHRLTPQRMAVLRILAESDEHPSVEQIHERVRIDLPMTSLATVYKTISLLKEMGQVLQLGFSDDSNRFDGRRPSPHPHLICIRCKRIVDPGVDALDRWADELGSRTGYQILSHRLDFYGICPDCQQLEQRSAVAQAHSLPV
jgi:Fur family peroxide stress response transcriptional regulator